KLGGEDQAGNPRLRTAILAARTQNMPNDNIDRAIRRGTGAEGVAALEEIIYEGYAPGGIAMILEAATDNKNRTAADIRLLFSKNNGNLSASGSVSYMFHRKGRVAVASQAVSEDRLLEIILDTGGEELITEDDHFIILTPPDKLYEMAEAIRGANVPVESQTLTFIPQNLVTLSDPETASQVLRLHDAFDDCDDVLNVYANFDISDQILSQIEHN
ncbi:MAG: YebC/PmpR family DNA-binding transcriptional regulator, partial [Chthoniobacterales bacterium]